MTLDADCDATSCSFCHSPAVISDGRESACLSCSILLTDAPCVCGETMPVRVVDGQPRCIGCLNAMFLAGRKVA